MHPRCKSKAMVSVIIYLLIINGGADYDSSEGVIGAVMMTKVFLDKASHFSGVCVVQC